MYNNVNSVDIAANQGDFQERWVSKVASGMKIAM